MVTYQTGRLQGTKLLIIRLVRWERCADVFNLICIITSRTEREIYSKGINFQRLPHKQRENTQLDTMESPCSWRFANATVYEEEEEGRKRFRQSTLLASVFSPLSAALCRSTSSAFTSSTLKGALTEWLSAASKNTLKLVSSIAVPHCRSTNVSP